MLFISGLWKSPAERSQTLSFSEPQRAQELFRTPIFSSSSNTAFNQFYWPARESREDSSAASTNKVTVERKLEPTTGGCRLFGIEIRSAVEETQRVVTVSGDGYDQMAASVDVDSGDLSQPSNVNNSNGPAASSERALLENQSRQVRSCTKVIVRHILKMLDFDFL